jgi:hypothetical protein
MFFTQKKNCKSFSLTSLAPSLDINSLNQTFNNMFYFTFFYFILLSITGSFFQINSNFLLFFTFTLFLIFIYDFFLFLNVSLDSFPYAINFYINELFFYNLFTLDYLKQSILNNNLLFFKNIFIYLKSFNSLVFFSSIVPSEVNLNIRNFLLSKTEDF